MNWYALQVLTGTERDVCTALRRKGVKARAPDQRMEIRRRGQWQTEDRLLLPGYVFVGADYNAALFHLVSPVPGGWGWSTASRRRWTLGRRCGGGWTVTRRWSPAGCCFTQTVRGTFWTALWRRLQAARCGWSGGSAGRM